jgi:Protein of unknown function (DUF3443)
LKRQFFSAATATPFLLGVISLLALAGCGGSNSSAAKTTVVSNTATLTAGSGPTGGAVNGLYVTVTVCQHGTTTCATINNVLVDTFSIGLRLVPSALGSVTLTPITVMNGSPLEECIQYGDTSYSWGPLEFADVQIGGETASNIPVQLLGQVSAPAPSNCLTTPVSPNVPNGGNEDTVASLGANGILGIGGFIFDCGNGCTTASSTPGFPYYICPNGTCQAVGVPTADQAVNPVAQFTGSDNNGVMITLPSVPSSGAVSVSGTMNFGIATRTDNALGNAVIYALDACGYFPTVNFGGNSYMDTQCTNNTGGLGGFLDTGSTALFVSDANTLKSFGISDCASGTAGFGLYCVSGGTATLLGVNLVGFGGVESATISLNINDATTLLSPTNNNAVFNDLGGDSVTGGSPSTDSWDLGLPFFLGRTVFVGIAGTAMPAGVNAPNGFVAF